MRHSAWALIGCCRPGLLAAGLLVAAPVGAAPEAWFARPSQLQALTELPDVLGEVRVVLVGETHPEYGDHLNQATVLRQLHQRYGARLVVGVEWFQQPFQAVLDRYVAGTLNLDQLLVQSEYFQRWRYDPRLYQPVLSYLQQQHIPTLALNVPSELSRQVGRGGLAALTPAQRAQLPALDTSDLAYRQRLEAVFNQHPGRQSFEHFHLAQLLWDEGMAARAARYLQAHPDGVMLILAGNGHLEYGSGIPNRLRRHLPALNPVIILNGTEALAPGRADFVLGHNQPTLPDPPSLGLKLAGEITLRVQGFAPHSRAQAAGVQVGDVLTHLAGQPLQNLAHLKWLLSQQTGDQVMLGVQRSGWFKAAIWQLPVSLAPLASEAPAGTPPAVRASH